MLLHPFPPVSPRLSVRYHQQDAVRPSTLPGACFSQQRWRKLLRASTPTARPDASCAARPLSASFPARRVSRLPPACRPQPQLRRLGRPRPSGRGARPQPRSFDHRSSPSSAAVRKKRAGRPGEGRAEGRAARAPNGGSPCAGGRRRLPLAGTSTLGRRWRGKRGPEIDEAWKRRLGRMGVALALKRAGTLPLVARGWTREACDAEALEPARGDSSAGQAGRRSRAGSPACAAALAGGLEARRPHARTPLAVDAVGSRPARKETQPQTTTAATAFRKPGPRPSAQPSSASLPPSCPPLLPHRLLTAPLSFRPSRPHRSAVPP